MASEEGVARYLLLSLASLALAASIILAASSYATGPIPVYRGDVEFDGSRAYWYAYNLSKLFPYRPVGSEGGYEAFKWISGLLESWGYDVRFQEFTVVLGEPKKARNVYGIKYGRLPEAVVVLTNYDMAPTSWEAASDTSGAVGVVLELARELSEANTNRAVVFAFVDSEEWGMQGARWFIEEYEGPDIKVVIVAEDLAPGGVLALSAESNGQFRGHSPLWLRLLVRDVAGFEGLEVVNPTGLMELVHRAIGKSFTDQGPILARGVPAIQVGTLSDDPELARRIYHTELDGMEHMEPESFEVYGRVLKRLLESLDRADEIPGYNPHYLSLTPSTYAPGWAVYASIIPLLAPSIYVAVRGREPEETPYLGGLLEVSGYFASIIAGVALIYASLHLGLIPEYDTYPPPPRHPVLYSPNIPLVVLSIVAPLAGAYLVRASVNSRISRRALSAAMITGILAGLLYNPYGVLLFVALPAALWPLAPLVRWWPARLALALGGALVFLALLAFFGEVLYLGPLIAWYLYLGIAYGQWSPGGVVLGSWLAAIFMYIVAHLRER